MSHRIEKFNDNIRDILSQIISQEISLKSGVFVSIVKVDTSRDLRYAQILVSVFPSDQEEYALTSLKKEIFKIQKILNQNLESKIFPRINFVLDQTQKNVWETEKIFDRIRKEREDH